MQPNENQPSDPTGRAITIHLTRDTLLLVAALAFLAVAILLAVIFPAASSSNVNSANTTIAQATANQSVAGRQTTVSTNPTSGLSVAQGGYPVLGGTAEAVTLTPAGESSSPTTEVASALDTGVDRAYPAETSTIPTSAPQTAITSTPTESTGPTPTQTPPVFQVQATNSPLPEVSPTETAQPTAAPIIPTARPTAEPTLPPTPTPVPEPTAIPVVVLRGNIRWTAAQSPIRLTRDQQLVAGATLIIEPGVEVRLAPGVSFFVEGTLYALGKADRPVRIIADSRQRWEGLFGRPGSNIALEYTDIHGGGAGGTLLTSESGNLVIHNSHINDNGGHIQVIDSRLELRDSEIAGNDLPYGAAVDAGYSSGGIVILTNNRIGGNRQQSGSPPVAISNDSPFDTVNLDIQRNLLVGQDSPDLVLTTNGPLQGGLTCNTLVGGTDGLSIRGETPQVPSFALTVRDNATEKHTPPIIPIYLKYGIGRGATSEVVLDMRNNWWGSSNGPYDPERHADGRGQAVGDNIEFAPWLTTRPACAPTQ